jgi:Arc/MetJ-type ribon-helix-helix transcriptional regulator
MFDPAAGYGFTLRLAFRACHAKLEAKEIPYMTIHLPHELESSIRAQVLSGQFASEDDMVAAAVRDYLLRHRQPSPAGQQPAAPTHKPIWEEIYELTASIPDEEFLKLPVDGAEQLDHYLYGLPKRPPSQ